jgi:class III poly(R)-hydroxyalkanoic acid synthase PhaE subunit
MTEEKSAQDEATALLGKWMKSAQEAWLQPMATAWSEAATQMLKAAAPADMTGKRTAANWDAALHTWQAMSAAMGDPASMDAAMKGLAALPDMALKLLQSTGSGMTQFQQKWTERLRKKGQSDAPFNFDDLDREFINRWTDLYKGELRQYLNIPQIGLTRFYQERLATAVDRHNLYQAAQAEFMHLLATPVEKSFRAMQQQLAEMAEKAPLPEDAKFYYNLWIKTLEGHFMTLFKSPEYTETMAKTTAALSGHLQAQRKVLEDLLQGLPVPTHRDMDDLYREIYALKKEIKRMKKHTHEE